jgi:hypothetical protein
MNNGMSSWHKIYITISYHNFLGEDEGGRDKCAMTMMMMGAM